VLACRDRRNPFHCVAFLDIFSLGIVVILSPGLLCMFLFIEEIEPFFEVLHL